MTLTCQTCGASLERPGAPCAHCGATSPHTGPEAVGVICAGCGRNMSRASFYCPGCSRPFCDRCYLESYRLCPECARPRIAAEAATRRRRQRIKIGLMVAGGVAAAAVTVGYFTLWQPWWLGFIPIAIVLIAIIFLSG